MNLFKPKVIILSYSAFQPAILQWYQVDFEVLSHPSCHSAIV